MFTTNLEVIQRHYGLVLGFRKLNLHLDPDAHLLLLLLPGLQGLRIESCYPDLELDEPGPNVTRWNKVLLVNEY